MFSLHGGRALQFHQEGFCLFRPQSLDWPAMVESASRELSRDCYSSAPLRKLAQDEELNHIIKSFYGRETYPKLPNKNKSKRTKFELETIDTKINSNPDNFACGVWIA